jgi:hypothetical protein
MVDFMPKVIRFLKKVDRFLKELDRLSCSEGIKLKQLAGI